MRRSISSTARRSKRAASATGRRGSASISHGRPFIVDRAFIDAYFLGDRLVELTDVAVDSGCALRARLSAVDIEIMGEEGRVVTHDDKVCFSHGVYLESLLAKAPHD